MKVKVKSLSHVWLFGTQGLQPTRLLHPWNFPGKNTGVGCHFLLQENFPTQGSNLVLPHSRQTLCHLSHKDRAILLLRYTKNVCESESHTVVSDSLWPHCLCSLWNSPGLNTGVGCHFLLQENFLTQGSNPGLLHCWQILHQLSYEGNLSIRFIGETETIGANIMLDISNHWV